MGIHGYIRNKKRRVEDREIKTTVYNILRNTEAIGCKTMEYFLLIRRVSEHLTQINLTHNTKQIERCVDEMIYDDMVYRVTNETTIKIGLVK